MSNDKLDPLPEPEQPCWDCGDYGDFGMFFTAAQMRAYAAKQVAAEQDRIRSLLALCSKETADVVGKYLDAAKREQP